MCVPWTLSLQEPLLKWPLSPLCAFLAQCSCIIPADCHLGLLLIGRPTAFTVTGPVKAALGKGQQFYTWKTESPCNSCIVHMNCPNAIFNLRWGRSKFSSTESYTINFTILHQVVNAALQRFGQVRNSIFTQEKLGRAPFVDQFHFTFKNVIIIHPSATTHLSSHYNEMLCWKTLGTGIIQSDSNWVSNQMCCKF